ncbi:DUF3515 domain-containing protein [Corynebacterium heidelbergense]|nr:DUF3515 domain-containing protein [Corynebacterium heidelbergense]WCZ36808.1 hypothetical protein CHEID_06355 [Corynebacterium heidelbergense]
MTFSGAGGSSNNHSAHPQVPAGSQRTLRTAIIAALVIAVLFVGGVILGARMLVTKQVYSPVSVSPVDAPEASSPTCSDVVGALTPRAGRFTKVPVQQPEPPGVGAYRSAQGTELTVRCGVYPPNQYTVLSQPQESGGTKWLELKDAVDATGLRTWYAVSSSPVVAVTSTADRQSVIEALTPIGETVKQHHGSAPAPTPKPYPLSTVALDPAHSTAGPACNRFTAKLPRSIANHDLGNLPGTHPPSLSHTYLPHGDALGTGPIVIRCGVAVPPSYAPGATLTQVNSVPWFKDTADGQDIWYALGRERVVAVSAPPQFAGDAVNEASAAIEQTLPARGQ